MKRRYFSYDPEGFGGPDFHETEKQARAVDAGVLWNRREASR